MKDEFSPVYLDDVKISLMGDEARPLLSRIVQTAGKRPESVEVRRMRGGSDAKGHVVALDATIDRTLEPTKPIYLRSVPKNRDDDAVIAQLGGVQLRDRSKPAPGKVRDPDAPVPPVKPIVLRRALRTAKAQAEAEAEAEERQEEQRSAEDIQQDELEALDQAEEDDRHMY